jgi:hypothetical protein
MYEVNSLKDHFATHDYYTLREMIINRNVIVEKLRSTKKVKDISPPKARIKKIRLSRNS